MSSVIILGAGPGGYEAALDAAARGFDVTLIDEKEIGGTCLNRGCIPTKAYLASAERLQAVREAQNLGIVAGEPRADFGKIRARKDGIVETLVGSIEKQLARAGVKVLKGHAELLDERRVGLRVEEGERVLEADYILLAAGSLPVLPEAFGYDADQVISSDDFLSLEALPKSMIIVGGGVIGCEIGQIASRLGVEVTIIEAMKHLLPEEDADTGKLLARALKREGIRVLTGKAVESVEKREDGVTARLAGGKTAEAEKMLVAVGRRPNTGRLGLSKSSLQTDGRGFIPVDAQMRTALPQIYAIGDIVPGLMLAHVATREGKVAVASMAGEEAAMSERVIARCVYTSPEVACVGLTEAACPEDCLVLEAQFRANGKAHCMGEVEGRVKLLFGPEHELVGASIVGAHASDLIGELSMAVEKGVTAEELRAFVHPHPSLSEVIADALAGLDTAPAPGRAR